MSEREGNCPGCGAPVDFAAPGALMVVCPFCDNASYRTDVDLELIGKVAQLAPLNSVLSLGTCGRFRDRDWRAVGQLQLDHGEGPWNEWCLLVEETAYLWLAEAQGELYVTQRNDDVAVPSAGGLRVGNRLAVGDEAWQVTELGQATVTGVRGSFPERILPGETYPYADIRGVLNQFGTVAWGSGQDGGAVYTGTRVDVRELSIDPNTVQAPPAPKRIATDRLGCPKCGSIVRLRDTQGTKRVVCESCGSMFDPRQEPYRVFGKASKLKQEPRVALGAKGRIEGEEVVCLAFLQRAVKNKWGRWPWEEYLLRTSTGEYRWLVENDGHWLYARPVNPAAANLSSRRAKYGRGVYRHFSGGKAYLESVLGEVYWEARVGEKVETNDYVAPPFALSSEKTKKELNVSLGKYVTADEVKAAFGEKVRMPRRQKGVAPAQPNPHEALIKPLTTAMTVLMCLFLLVAVGTTVSASNRVAATQTFDAYTGTAGPTDKHADQRVVFSEPFELKERGNVEFAVSMSHANAWVGVGGALVDTQGGNVYPFTIEMERWTGPGWSEGSGAESSLLGSIPPGLYALRLESQAAIQNRRTQRVPEVKVPVRVVVRSDVPTYTRWVLLLVALMLPQIVIRWRRTAFETARWAESDHA